MARRAGGKPRATGEAQGSAAAELERLLGHRFARPELLELALTHRSFVYDMGTSPGGPNAGMVTLSAGSDAASDVSHPSHDNEQLEFLGDAVLGLLAAEVLCERFPASREGELTRMRAAVVSRRHLGEVGTRLQLGRWLRLGHTAEKNNGRHNAALFANAVEALIAAMYLDGGPKHGLAAARRFVEAEVLAGALPGMAEVMGIGEQFQSSVGDHKSALQELLQAQGRPRPEYRLLSESGPDHRRVFRVQVWLADEALAEAEGSTKKQAQQEAARLAVAHLASLKPGELQPIGATAHA